jgi:hypothetical protein
MRENGRSILSATPSYWLLNSDELADYVRLCALGEQVETELQRWVREQDRRIAQALAGGPDGMDAAGIIAP